MSRSYTERYGQPAQTIYPSRAANCPEYDEPPPRLARNDDAFTVAFAGTINSNGYIRALIAVQDALKSVGGRLLIFGPTTPAEAKQSGLTSAEIRGLLPAAELLTILRDEADALFVPMSFDAADRVNMEIAFPSKLADYTATGLPLLIYGPGYCSAVTWAHENSGVAMVVDSEPDLRNAITDLAHNPDTRITLGRRALIAGREYFTHVRAQQLFHQSLSA
jgi:glycosyltransferase involved in cell wall biosynthesis